MTLQFIDEYVFIVTNPYMKHLPTPFVIYKLAPFIIYKNISNIIIFLYIINTYFTKAETTDRSEDEGISAAKGKTILFTPVRCSPASEMAF